MFNDRWLKLITENGTVVVQEEIPGLLFLGARESPPVAISNNVKMQGVDGELPGIINYDPFNLTIYLGFDGYDIEDVDLAEQKIRGLFNTRTRYYVVHSQMPGKKYAVDPPDIGPPEFLDATALTFEITFTVYKGYAESLYDTDQFSLMSDNWQFESGLLPDNEITYTHKRSDFKIFNGSSDTINPRMRHKLKIYMQLNANNGFRLVNKTTGDIFQYKQAIDINTPLVIEGGYPYLIVNDKYSRCGRSTNHGIITLAPGYNKFEIWGNADDVNIKFIFPFIYR
ncbi:phage tail protein [Salmonella sp. 3DZ2-4SM]|nr:phage tail protein [Salmonella sp. 3DZ2-4SM]